MTANIKQMVVELICELMEEDGLPIPELEDGTVLLESGLDSLGFAVLVTRLEEALGYDPFSMMEEPVYPTTLAEFVAVYEAHAPTSRPPST